MSPRKPEPSRQPAPSRPVPQPRPQEPTRQPAPTRGDVALSYRNLIEAPLPLNGMTPSADDFIRQGGAASIQ